MQKNKNTKSPTAALRERVTATYSEMRGTPQGGEGPNNPWDLMLQNANETTPHKIRRLPRFDWTSLAVWLAVAAAAVSAILLLK